MPPAIVVVRTQPRKCGEDVMATTKMRGIQQPTGLVTGGGRFGVQGHHPGGRDREGGLRFDLLDDLPGVCVEIGMDSPGRSHGTGQSRGEGGRDRLGGGRTVLSVVQPGQIIRRDAAAARAARRRRRLSGRGRRVQRGRRGRGRGTSPLLQQQQRRQQARAGTQARCRICRRAWVWPRGREWMHSSGGGRTP